MWIQKLKLSSISVVISDIDLEPVLPYGKYCLMILKFNSFLVSF